MAEFRDYHAGRQEMAGEPVGFVVADQRFAVPLPLPALALFDLYALTAETDYRRIAQGSWAFLRDVVDLDDIERLETTLRRQRVDASTLLSIAQGVVEDASGRPTSGQDDSAALPSTTGPPSKPAAHSAASTPGDSPLVEPSS